MSDHYYTSQEVYDKLTVLPSAYCQPVVLPDDIVAVGHGFDGEDLTTPPSNSPYGNQPTGGTAPSGLRGKVKCFRINDGVGLSSKPRVVIIAGVHARELLPPQAATDYFVNLITAYKAYIDSGSKSEQPLKFPKFLYQSRKKAFKDKFGLPVNGNPDKNMLTPISIPELIIPWTEIISIIKGLDIYFVPVVNPFGRDYVLTDISSEPSPQKETRRQWRKNRANLASLIHAHNNPLVNFSNIHGAAPAQNNLPVTPKDRINLRAQTNAPLDKEPLQYPIGVDLNRNSPIAWNAQTYYTADLLIKAGIGSTADPGDFETFRGEGPASEAETKSVLRLLKFNDPTVSRAVTAPADYTGLLYFFDMHSAEGKVYYPWGMEMNGNDVSQNYTNSYFDSSATSNVKGDVQGQHVVINGMRDGTDGTDYNEFFPPILTFPNHADYPLAKTHIQFADAISLRVNNDMTKGFDASSPDYKNIKTANYYKVEQAATFEPSAGSFVDYAYSLNIGSYANNNTSSSPGVSVITAANRAPVISITIEIGSLEDGGLRPLNSYLSSNPNDPPGTKIPGLLGLYDKQNREATLALHAFLLKCAQEKK